MKNTLYMINSSTGGQMNSFVITTEDGYTIVMDGGFYNDADNLLAHLREITGEPVPRVDAWFLSHPHRDHIHCFIEIMKHHTAEVVVERIYYNFPSHQYCAWEAQPHDCALGLFMDALPLFADRVEIVSCGDVYEIGNARIEVLYTPSADIQQKYINNASIILMFTLGGKKILFLGDAGEEEGDRCLALYAGTDTLKADYVQMAHHGQAGVRRNFYEAVAPTACLWCTPAWLWNNDIGDGYNTCIWDSVTVQSWMDELGVREHYILKDGTHKIDFS